MLQDANPATMIHKVIPVTVNAAVLPGQAVYDNNCSGCHKLGTYDPNGYAPNLSAKGGLVPTKFPTPGVAGHNGITLSVQQITDVSAFLNAN
jgi:mono/diheme cytochrome c family protein